MDLNKNAMYAQAGRNRGWNIGAPNDDAAPPTMMPANQKQPMQMIDTMATLPTAPQMAAPPVIELPMTMKPDMDCQTLAMAYVQKQKWQDIYEVEQGFHRGTIFAELDLPFVGEGACRHE